MKKMGFTLAEILVTLGIIGVITSISLPTFIAGVHNRANASKLAATVADYENIFGTMMLKEDKVSILETSFGTAMTSANATAVQQALAKYTKLAKSATNVSDLGYTAYIHKPFVGGAYAETPYNPNDPNNPDIIADDDIDPCPDGSTTCTSGITGGGITYSSGGTSSTGSVMKDISGNTTSFNFLSASQSGSGSTAFFVGDYDTRPTEANATAAGASCNIKASTVYLDVNGAENPNRFGRDIFAFVLGDDGALYPFGTKTASFLNNVTGNPTWSDDNTTYGCSSGAYNGLGCTARLIENNYKVNY